MRVRLVTTLATLAAGLSIAAGVGAPVLAALGGHDNPAHSVSVEAGRSNLMPKSST